MSRISNRMRIVGLCGAVLAIALPAAAQAQTQAQQTQTQTQSATQQAQDPARGQRSGRGAARQGLPPVGPNMSPQQLQAWIDAYALVQAERELQLTQEQYPDFVARLTRLQNMRRRMLGDRRRVLGEISALLQESPGTRDDVITEKLRTLDDLSRRSVEELRKAYADVDAALTPWQRGRFRLFEEQLERRKLELLSKVGTGQIER